MDNIVFLGSDPEPMRYCSILPNYHLAAQLALKHLRINGHQLIAYPDGISAFDDHKELTVDPHFHYYQASQASRDNYDPSLVLDYEVNIKSGYAAIRNLLEAYGRPPEAMFIVDDSIVPGAMMALREWGLWAPEDISIITFNSTVLSECSDPPLASIELFMRENIRAIAFYIQLPWQGNVRGKRIVVPYELASQRSVTPAPTDSPLSELQSE